MRFSRLQNLLFVGSFLVVTIPAASLPKDAQAAQILQATLNASGGAAAIQSTKDLRARGEISYNWGLSPLHGTATITLIGTAQCKFEMSVPEHERAWYVSGNKGKISENGKTSRLPFHAVVGRGGFALPILKLAFATAVPNFVVSFVGIEKAGDRELYHLRAEKRSAVQAEDEKSADGLEAADYFIDRQTMLITKTTSTIHPPENQSIDQPHTLEFDDFRPINGIPVPFSITEHIENAEVWSLHLSEASLNQSLTASDIEF